MVAAHPAGRHRRRSLSLSVWLLLVWLLCLALRAGGRGGQRGYRTVRVGGVPEEAFHVAPEADWSVCGAARPRAACSVLRSQLISGPRIDREGMVGEREP